jgi:hypothetical protein
MRVAVEHFEVVETIIGAGGQVIVLAYHTIDEASEDPGRAGQVGG